MLKKSTLPYVRRRRVSRRKSTNDTTSPYVIPRKSAKANETSGVYFSKLHE